MSWHTIHRDLQEDVKARLENDPYFSDITVLLQRRGNIESDVMQALGTLNEKTGKLGACCVVLMPETEAPEGENLPGPPIEIVISLQVIEQTTMNEDTANGGTGKSAESIANVALNLLHRYIPYLLGNVLVADRKPIRPVQAEGVVMYLVTLRLRTGLDNSDKVLTPQLSEGGGSITITCGTLGASIYYTTDGSYPGPANATATLYTAPFATPVAGTVIRHAASKTGLIPSDTAASEIE